MLQDIFPHTLNNEFLSGVSFQENDYALYLKDSSILLKKGEDSYSFPTKTDLGITDQNTVFLFTLDGINCFLVRSNLEIDSEHLEFHSIRYAPEERKNEEIEWACAVASHLNNWYNEHQFCGRCGTVMYHKSYERAMECPNCQSVHYPIISPAVIVAILHENKLLLAHNVNFPEGLYSLVAGYVDIGESIEETVIREVREEVGIKIKNLRYYKSQPWAFSGSMMLGFVAEADGEQEIVVDAKEIEKAAWFTKDNLPKVPRDISIAGEMINLFVEGKLYK